MASQYGDLPAGWEAQILYGIGAPVTPANVTFLDAWNQREHGVPYSTVDTFNPFNTTLSEPGAVATNSAGVKAYPSWATGLDATVSTLQLSAYAGLRGLLQSGTATAQQLGASPDLSTWGTGQFNPANYATTPSASSGSPSRAGSVSPICTIPLIGNRICGAVDSARQAAGGALGWVGKTFGKWLILIGIGLAMLLVLMAMVRGGEMGAIRRAA